jgi:hypothetical protein
MSADATVVRDAIWTALQSDSTLIAMLDSLHKWSDTLAVGGLDDPALLLGTVLQVVTERVNKDPYAGNNRWRFDGRFRVSVYVRPDDASLATVEQINEQVARALAAATRDHFSLGWVEAVAFEDDLIERTRAPGDKSVGPRWVTATRVTVRWSRTHQQMTAPP